MLPSNRYIADQFSLLSRLMDVHGENSFKSKSYSIAAYNIEQIPVQIAELPREKIFSFKGIGESVGKKIIEILETGELGNLQDLLKRTPAGVLEMLTIKGLGPRKISTIWKEMEIESVGELMYACNENRLLLYNGFGEKPQRNVQEAIEFMQKSKGSHLYSEIEHYALEIDKKLQQAFPDSLTRLTGQFRRQLTVIDKLEWVTTASSTEIKNFFAANGFEPEAVENQTLTFRGTENVTIQIYCESKKTFLMQLFKTSCSDEFLQACEQHPSWNKVKSNMEEPAIFKVLKFPFIPASLRENASITERDSIPELIQTKDIKAIIHCHSNWSDGRHTIEELARACIAMKMEYLVITDHSKSAFYAKGLQEERIKEQHLYIDELNSSLTPFKIFKGIECDILHDGAMDYPDRILGTFDVVIASIHSNMKMNQLKATDRLIKAIENPYTTILGHMTGRLLLSRNGYPVDHKKVIDACAENHVVIEVNAHPRRLDMDWRWIDYAMDLGVIISIDPDAHYITGFDHIRYGVLAAQKGGLTKQNNLSSYTLRQFEAYLANRRKQKGF